jgi:hypothetical protein
VRTIYSDIFEIEADTPEEAKKIALTMEPPVGGVSEAETDVLEWLDPPPYPEVGSWWKQGWMTGPRSLYEVRPQSEQHPEFIVLHKKGDRHNSTIMVKVWSFHKKWEAV